MLLAACVPAQPMTASAAFVEPLADRAPAQDATACGLRIVEVGDARLAPETLGVVSGRAIKAPPDRDAWLRSVAMGLGSRGYSVRFAAPAGDSREVQVSITLKSLWVYDLTSNKVANVVISVAAQQPGHPGLSRDYRGDITRVNWSSSDDELQKLTNAAFGLALDKVGQDLRALCPDQGG